MGHSLVAHPIVSSLHGRTASVHLNLRSALQGEDLASLKQGAGLEKGLWNGFYGAGGQGALSQHASGSFLDRRRPYGLDCRIDESGGRGVRSQAPHRSPKDVHSRGVLRSRAGTILLSGTQWPIASFGSPGGHNLSLGTQAQGPSPAFQWMLSPVTGSLPVRRARLCERQLPHTHRSRPVLLRRFQSRRVVLLARPPQCQRDRGDLPRDGQLRQVRLRATVQ